MAKELFAATIGSHNYNLNTPESDKDMVKYVTPTFNEIYKGLLNSYNYSDNNTETTVHDVRRLPELLWKSNPNQLEAIFSNNIAYLYDDNDTKNHDYFIDIFNMKNDISRINVPYLFDATVGMHKSYMGKLEKSKSFLDDDTIKYDCKAAMNAVRTLLTIIRFYNNDFDYYGKAIRYHGADKRFLLEIKSGFYSYENIKNMIDHYQHQVMVIEKSYKNFEPNYVTLDELNRIVKELVKYNIKKELST